MSTPLLGGYRPGDTWLHRTVAAVKLVALAVLSIVVVTVRGPGSGLVALGLALVLVLWSGMGWRLALKVLRTLLLVSVLVAGYLIWQRSWALAVEQVSDLVALVLLAAVLTATTAVDDILEVVTTALGPTRRLGVHPERVALAFSMVLRAIPSILEVARETRDAARARGLERSPRALLTPMVIRTVAQARRTGEALHARGLADD
ncbi:energy-coupling factor transporter transmembrane component T family protein [Nocardioides campestrisoli]|uniref:energy-coupling factor transporter transmembrane component T family protein n=1 Tax=Nocardioides campestrisoli TaxID=2736757 RepID=UPI0015E7848C|nr:energy-coupling factor transporter transmembrane protein EcfT [Nocardioides campestrisoli]